MIFANRKNKGSMELENKIKCILMDFEINEITLQEATKRILLLLDVVGRSEQFYCTCSRAKGLDHDEEGMPYCIECQKPVQ
jgi:hypothetical protein